MSEWCEDEDRLDPDERRWPMAPTDLLPRERWRWFEQLWSDVLALGDRYRIRLAKHWWEDGVQVEALAALSAWVDATTAASGTTRPAKLSLLYDVERVRELIRGNEPFIPAATVSRLAAF